jgi:ketosteroid isomerase-like protein
MSNIKESVNELYQMVLSGQAMDAFEKYYDENVVMQENDMPATVGKAANRQRELEFFGNIAEFRGASVGQILISGDTACIESSMDYVHKQYGDVKMTQVAVQRWKDGKIVSERFLY